jgi:hypothetical protein
MTANTPTPDYGEPWSEQSPPHPIARDKGVYWLNPEQFNRAIACVNACAGMSNPEKEIAAMRDAIREAASQLVLTDHDPECQHLFRVLYGQDKFPCNCGRDATLAKLKPYINQ